MSWGSGAPCTQMDPELWFPVGEMGRGKRVRDLVQVCKGCEVRTACARTALEIGAAHGVWAGVDLGDGDVTKGRRRARELLTAIAVTPDHQDEVNADSEPSRMCGSCGQEFRTKQNRGTCWSCSRDEMIPAAPVTEHVSALRDVFGWSYREIERRTGVDRTTVSRLADGGIEKVGARTAERLLAVTSPDAERVSA